MNFQYLYKHKNISNYKQVFFLFLIFRSDKECNIITDSHGRRFIYSVNIIDLDPKPFDKIQKYETLESSILQTYKEALWWWYMYASKTIYVCILPWYRSGFMNCLVVFCFVSIEQDLHLFAVGFFLHMVLHYVL